MPLNQREFKEIEDINKNLKSIEKAIKEMGSVDKSIKELIVTIKELNNKTNTNTLMHRLVEAVEKLGTTFSKIGKEIKKDA